MGAIASFDYAKWTARYPEFSNVPQQTAQAYFDEASLFWSNDGTGPVDHSAQQTILMNMATAHIASLAGAGSNGGQVGVAERTGGPLPVGRVASATEGGVSVSFDAPGKLSSGAAWYAQTQYGLQFWQLTAPFRTFRYAAAPAYNPDPYGPSQWRR